MRLFIRLPFPECESTKDDVRATSSAELVQLQRFRVQVSPKHVQYISSCIPNTLPVAAGAMDTARDSVVPRWAAI